MAQKKQWMRRGAAFALALTTAASMHAGALATIPVQEDGTVVAQTEPEVQEKQTQTATIDSASMETAESESAELAESEQIEAVAEEVPAVQLVEVNEPESGLRFDSVKNEYVQVQGTVQIPNTVEVWAKIDTEEDRRQIIMNNYGRGGNTWGIEVTADNTLRYWEEAEGNKIDWKTDIEICTGDWMLISVVRNIEESKIQVYINGALEAEHKVSAFAEDAELSSGWLCFGSDYHSTPLPLDGEIAEVRFWDTARTAEEIAQNASYDAVDEAEGLAHLWQLDEAEDLGPDTVFEDQTGNVDVKAVGFQAAFEEPDEETNEVVSIDFDNNETGAWTTLDGSSYKGASVEDGVLKLEQMEQNEPVFLTGDSTAYLTNAVYEVRAKSVGGDDTSFGFAFRGSVNEGTANWLVFKSNGELLAQTSEDWSDPWTDAEYTLENDTWYDFRITMIGKTIKVEVKKADEDSYTMLVDGSEDSYAMLVDGSNDTIWDGWMTNAGYLGFCNWGAKSDDFYIDSLTITPADASEVKHTVQFDLQQGSYAGDDIEAQTVLDAGLVTEPKQEPTKDGFTFTGWYHDAACTEPWDFAADSIWKDTTIYAGWEYIYQSAGFEDMTGIAFDGPADQLAMEERLSEVPLTFEATVKLPKDLEGRGGVIIGNYMDAGYYDYDLGYVSLEVYEDGAPRLYWHQERRDQPNGGVQSVIFSGVDLRQDDWVHLAVTFDPDADTARCYINGVLVSTVEDCAFYPVVPAQALKVGGDYRGSGGQVTDNGYNAQYFKGEIANVSVWSNVRTGEQIAADVAALQQSADQVPGQQDGLLASWQFDEERDLYEDLSASDNDVAAFVDWIEPEFAQGDYSMIALPDTQFLSQTFPDIYKKLTQWIVDNQETYNIHAVMHMGDMVNSGNSTQWNNCEDAMYILDSDKDIAWMPMRGNHDDSNGFNQTFPYERFASRDYFGGSYEYEVLGEEKLDCNYWEVTVGEREYLILSLGWAPNQAAITWADGIIKANPDKNVIVTTHAFMYWDGTHLNDEDLDYTSAYIEDGLDGSDIWEQLGAQNENVVLAIGGHIGFPDVIARADENGAGKQVTSLLCDAQGIDGTYGLGMLMMLTFHEDSNAVDINWYSAEEGKLFRTRNQFTIDVPHVGESESVSITSVAAQAAITAKTGTKQDELNLPDTVEVTLSDGTVTKLPVIWQCASYDADEEGTYVFVGTLQNTSDVENPLGLTAEITVTLERPTSGGASHPEAGDTSSDRDDEEEDSSEETTEDIDEEDVPLDEGSNTEFADVDSNAWYADAVTYVCEKGLMNGTSETAFSPNQTTTRSMIVTMLYRLENEPAITGTTAFADVAADQYYANAVAWAAQNGIVSGVDGTTFAPNNAITREQMAAILYRYAQFKGYDVSAKADLSTYADAASVGTYAADAMAWANGAELITGTSATALSPAGQATRAQVAAILMRFCENIAK